MLVYVFAGSPGGVRYCTGRIEGGLGTRGEDMKPGLGYA